MHEVEPVLYWRVKRQGTWKFEKAKTVVCTPIKYFSGHMIDIDDADIIALILSPEVIESEK